MHKSDEEWMSDALLLAGKAVGDTSPNPCVGAIITKDNRILGKGYHHRAGQPHAEIEALKDAGYRVEGATCYVTLEPCCIHAKTPPCTVALIKAGVARVVYAVDDPNPRISGRGRKQLEDAGIQVSTGVLSQQAAHLNRYFFHFIRTGLPYVTLKYAMTADGKIATRTGESQWITGLLAREEAHRLRALSDAVLVGAGTVRKDDPALTVRLQGRTKNPARVILDDSRGLTPEFRVFQPRKARKVYLFSTVSRSDEEIRRFLDGGTEIHRLKDRSHLTHVLKTLARDHVMHLMIEGGGKVAGSFLYAGLVQEIWVFIGPRIFGSEKAPSPIGDPGWDELVGAPHLKPFEHLLLGDDLLIKYRTGG